MKRYVKAYIDIDTQFNLVVEPCYYIAITDKRGNNVIPEEYFFGDKEDATKIANEKWKDWEKYIKSFDYPIHIGDRIKTPKFPNVFINDVFDNQEECEAAGYTVPTGYKLSSYDIEHGIGGILGKVTDDNDMEFAAYMK